MNPIRTFPERHCENCGEALVRKIFSSGLERTSVFAKRKHCGDECREAAQTAKHIPSNGAKACSVCREAKPLEHFAVYAGRPSGRQSRCRECHNEAAKKSYQRHKQKRRDWHLRKTFGISAADYELMLTGQGGKCAICGRREDTSHTRGGIGAIRLAVDHCHETGAVRGLLCRSCNTAIGKFRHDPLILKAAIEYLERQRCKQNDSRLETFSPSLQADFSPNQTNTETE